MTSSGSGLSLPALVPAVASPHLPLVDPALVQSASAPALNKEEGAKNFIEHIDYREIVEKEILGKGSFGLVVRAEWRNSDVALKVFQTDNERNTFVVELRQLSRLSHKNIITLYGASTRPPQVYLIMEYAECGSLYKVLHQIKPLIPYHSGHAISWCLQCAEGVEYLHNLRPSPLIHRDLKSPNLLLFQKGLVLKICDFGTACDKQTIMTNNKGSAAWMAPEVFEGVTYTEKCDTFSWGMILWEVLTRRLPYDDIGGNDLRVLWAIHNGQRPPLIEGCPETLEDLMKRCWDKDTQVRPTFTEVVSKMKFIQQFFPDVSSDPLDFPEDASDNDTQISEHSFGSALASVVSPPSEVVAVAGRDRNPDVSKNKITIRSTQEYPDYIIKPANTINQKANNTNPCVPSDNETKLKAYFTPPEDDPTSLSSSPIPVLNLPVPDRGALDSAPSNLLRGVNRLHPQMAWPEEDSGPIPSDIELVRGIDNKNPPRYPLSDYKPNVYLMPDLSGDSSSESQRHPHAGYQWTRSYQNPIGSVYHAPEDDFYQSFGRGVGPKRRPISADVNRLFSVEEDCLAGGMERNPSGAQQTNFKKGHRRSSSYGSCTSTERPPHGAPPPHPHDPSLYPHHQYPPYLQIPPDSQLQNPHPDVLMPGLNRSFSNLFYDETDSRSQQQHPQPPLLLANEMPPQFHNNPQTGGAEGGRQAYFDYERDAYLDRAIEMLNPDLRPVPPQPNCRQSVQIYQDHRMLAANYLEVQKEISDLRKYKEELEARLKSESEGEDEAKQEEVEKFVRLQSERESLLQFQEKLSAQLQLINKATTKAQQQQQQLQAAAAQNSHPGHSSENLTARSVEDGAWILVQNQK